MGYLAISSEAGTFANRLSVLRNGDSLLFGVSPSLADAADLTKYNFQFFFQFFPVVFMFFQVFSSFFPVFNRDDIIVIRQPSVAIKEGVPDRSLSRVRTHNPLLRSRELYELN